MNQPLPIRPEETREETPEDDHGVAGWPGGPGSAAPSSESLPERLPDGRPWPAVHAIVLPAAPGGDRAARRSASLAALEAQGYPRLSHETVPDDAAADAALRAALAETDAGSGTGAGPDYLLLLRAGDLPAPGALAALCLEAALSGADAVAGLRVLYGHGVHGLDVLFASPAGAPPPAEAGALSGEILLARQAARAVPDLLALSPEALWHRLGQAALRRATVGRPVLLCRAAPPAGEAARGLSQGLSIVSLTDLGFGGGAGIAHRRLVEALELAGHRVTRMRLGDESPASAAEWTSRFPLTEGAILSGGHDLVLAGNLHGVTRHGGLWARLSRRVPTALVLHDLFPLTGRCAYPKDCPVIATGCDARCPSPTDYPQLAPDRIAAVHAGKRAALAPDGGPLLLANSDWTQERARALAPEGAAVGRLHLGFPTGVFRPRDRTALRRRLGLPEHDVLVLFAAVIADAPDKGFADLVATMARVARPGVGFVAVGRLDDPERFGLPGLHVAGPVGDEETLAQWYAACDVYLTASRLETLGQTPIEAGLCGVPAVAYRATGLTSAVIDGVSGLLVEPGEGTLAAALDALIADAPRRRRLGAFARIALESRCSHAAAALSLHAALADWPAMRAAAAPVLRGGRLRFAPALLGRFAFARDRHPGAAGLVAAPSHPLVRRLRLAKHAVLGRGMPLWMRRGLYAADLLRRPLSRTLRHLLRPLLQRPSRGTPSR